MRSWINTSIKILRESLLTSKPSARAPSQASVLTLKQQLGLLQVLVNMAAFTDGRKAVLHAPSSAGALDLISSLVDPPSEAPRTPSPIVESALLFLRNLCFSPDAKAHLLAHPSLLSSCLSHIERAAEAPKASSIASSALCALVHHGEKVKAALRRLPNAVERLAVVKATCEYRLQRGRLDDGGGGQELTHTLANVIVLLDSQGGNSPGPIGVTRS